MRIVFSILLCSLFAGAVTASATVKPTDAGFNGYSRRVWNAQDGLPDQSIQALAQTPDGYLWIGTDSGLLRFDGERFTNFGQDVDPGSGKHAVHCLLTSRDGSLWIGTEGGGLLRFRDQKFQRYPTAGGQANQFVNAIFEDSRGTLWVGSDQGLFSLDGSVLRRVDNRGLVPVIEARAIVEDQDGHIWVGGSQLLEFNGDALIQQYPLPDGRSASLVTSMLFDRDGTLWIGMRSGLYRMTRSGKLSRDRRLTAAMSFIAQTFDGTVWLATVSDGLFYTRGSQMFSVVPSNLPSTAVRAILEDREGDLWCGTLGGLMRLGRTPVSAVTLPGGTDSEDDSIYLGRDGTLLVATAGHLYQIRNGIAKHYDIPGIGHIPVSNAILDRKGNLWVGTNGKGIFEIHDGRMNETTTRQGLSNDFIRGIYEGSDGSIWVGTESGVNHLTTRGVKAFNVSDGLAYFCIEAMFEDHSGNVWVGTSRGVTHIYKDRIVYDDVTHALAREQVRSINEDESGEVWFATDNGLYGWKGGSLVHIVEADGLASNAVYQVLCDGRGNIWLSGPNTISRLRAQDLDGFRPGHHVELTFYADPYALESATLDSALVPDGAVEPNGDVWFPSSKGPIRISVKQISPAIVSPVSIEQVNVGGQSVPLNSRIEVGPGITNLEITYGAIDLGVHGGLRYRYQLEGLEPWSNAGTRRTAYYTQLPPGRYRFRVQAFEIDNPGVVNEASITLVQKRHFYATFWFLALCLFGILGIVFLSYRLRLYQMRLRFQAVSAERARLAREMHDTVIQGCVGVFTLLGAIQEVESTDAPLRRDLLAFAIEQVGTTIGKARDAVWALRNSATSQKHIGAICEELGKMGQLESGIPIRCRVRGIPFTIGEDATHEVMMTLKEALKNAVSHANATSIQLMVAFQEQDMEIEVSDDGCGFDPKKAAADGHYGLVGMAERVNLLGGSLQIESNSVSKGTTLRIKVPRRTR